MIGIVGGHLSTGVATRSLPAVVGVPTTRHFRAVVIPRILGNSRNETVEGLGVGHVSVDETG